MELLILGAFCAGLLLCIACGISILYALAFGLLVFMLYGKHKGFSWRELAGMAFSGIRKVRGILITFVLIGILTALWRAAGTISFLVCHASKLIRPSLFLLMTFLLNCALSVLTGTSFGTAATVGVICASMGSAMNVSPLLTGGAILSGAFFGDRCSPVSTSALLVAAVTETDIYDNIRRMIRSALLPFALTCLIYLLIGLSIRVESSVSDLTELISSSFRLNILAVVPALAVLLLSLLRVNVKISMLAGILTAIPLCILFQGHSLPDVLGIAVTGFNPSDPEIAYMIGGGGVLSMLKVAFIVCISSAYSDILDKTGLLDASKRALSLVSARTNTYAVMLLTSILSGMIACNQTLTILLTDQLCREMYADKGQLALDLEDTAVIVSPLIPWSIAGAVPLAAVNAPASSVCVSFYLILLPLYRLITATREKTGIDSGTGG